MKTQLHIAVREGRKAVIPTDLPIIFSAGPIRNAPRWHNAAMQHALNRDEKIFFASPVRDTDEGLSPHLQKHMAPFVSDENFPRQRAWEQYYLNHASIGGCIFFWLAKPLPREEWQWPNKSYAQISMLELGTWLERRRQNYMVGLAIGIEDGFPEASTIRYEIETMVPEITIFSTLEDTVNEAVDIVLRKHRPL